MPDADEKIETAKRKYFQSPKGKKAQRKYLCSSKGKKRLHEYYLRRKARLQLLKEMSVYLQAHPGATTTDFVQDKVRQMREAEDGPRGRITIDTGTTRSSK